MSQTAFGKTRKQKWYNNNIFPLIPIIEIKKEDKYNTKGFIFRWLFFTFWTLDSFEFEVSVVANTHWGVGVIFILPYLRGVVTIPCPEKVTILLHKYLNRKTKHEARGY